MPTPDQIQLHFTAQEKTDIAAAFITLESLLFPKCRNLTPKERQDFGSIGEYYKGFVNKVNDYHTNQAALQSPDVDWTEFDADYFDRELLESSRLRLDALRSAAFDTEILHDYDNYQNALRDKQFTDYKANQTNDPAYEAKSNELKAFFPGRPPGGGNP